MTGRVWGGNLGSFSASVVTPPGPALDAGGWKWVPAALLHHDRPGCLFHNLRASRRREDGGNPFLGAPEQLWARQSKTETVLAFAQ